MKFTKQDITIKAADGPRLIPALVCDGLAYHPDIAEGDRWAVTHAASGLALHPYSFAAEAEAQAFLALYAALPVNWRGSQKEIVAQMKPNAAIVTAIAKAVESAFMPTRHADTDDYTHSYATVTTEPGNNWHIASTWYAGLSMVNEKVWYVETDHVRGDECGDAEADARRLATCWNALYGIPQKTLLDPAFRARVLALVEESAVTA